MARHPHADLMIQAAENWDRLEWSTMSPERPGWSQWTLFSEYWPDWRDDFLYQLRPIRKPRYQKRVEIPRAETEAPEDGVYFYSPDPNSRENPYMRFCWNNGDYHRWLLEVGLVYLKSDDAAEHARAMLETEYD